MAASDTTSTWTQDTEEKEQFAETRAVIIEVIRQSIFYNTEINQDVYLEIVETASSSDVAKTAKLVSEIAAKAWKVDGELRRRERNYIRAEAERIKKEVKDLDEFMHLLLRGLYSITGADGISWSKIMFMLLLVMKFVSMLDEEDSPVIVTHLIELTCLYFDREQIHMWIITDGGGWESCDNVDESDLLPTTPTQIGLETAADWSPIYYPKSAEVDRVSRAETAGMSDGTLSGFLSSDMFRSYSQATMRYYSLNTPRSITLPPMPSSRGGGSNSDTSSNQQLLASTSGGPKRPKISQICDII